MREVPESVREIGDGDEPGAQPHAEQRRHREQEGDVELDLLLDIVAARHGEAEIDAGDDPEQDRREGERHLGA